MEFREFMDQVEKQIAAMSNEERTACLLNLLRGTPAANREQVLEQLSATPGSEAAVNKQFEAIQRIIEELEEEETHFLAEGYEVYNEDYWDSDYKYEYTDPNNTAAKIHKCLEGARELLYQKHYKEALTLYESLAMMPFNVCDEETDDEWDLDLEELAKEDILHIDLPDVAAHLMYALCQSAIGEERLKTLLLYYHWPMCQKISLSEVFDKGPEPVKETEKLLHEWIDFLQGNPSSIAQNRMLEAVAMSEEYQDPDRLYSLAQKNAEAHPELYLRCMDLLIRQGKSLPALKAGTNGIERIPASNSVRSEVAKKVIVLAEQNGDNQAAHSAYLAAFYSHPTVDNLLALLEQKLFSQGKQHLISFVKTSGKIEDKSVFLFFLGEFAEAYVRAAKDKQALGWSSAEKGTIIPLFLLLFREEKASQAAKSLTDRVAYRVYQGDKADFAAAFSQWKERVKIPAAEKQSYFSWCKREVENRGKSLIDTKFRSHYRNMAALLVVTGEAEEGLGVEGARQQLIDKYLKLHYRKRNFTSELKGFV